MYVIYVVNTYYPYHWNYMLHSYLTSMLKHCNFPLVVFQSQILACLLEQQGLV